jgi:hypothetical protein
MAVFPQYQNTRNTPSQGLLEESPWLRDLWNYATKGWNYSPPPEQPTISAPSPYNPATQREFSESWSPIDALNQIAQEHKEQQQQPSVIRAPDPWHQAKLNSQTAFIDWLSPTLGSAMSGQDYDPAKLVGDLAGWADIPARGLLGAAGMVRMGGQDVANAFLHRRVKNPEELQWLGDIFKAGKTTQKPASTVTPGYLPTFRNDEFGVMFHAPRPEEIATAGLEDVYSRMSHRFVPPEVDRAERIIKNLEEAKAKIVRPPPPAPRKPEGWQGVEMPHGGHGWDNTSLPSAWNMFNKYQDKVVAIGGPKYTPFKLDDFSKGWTPDDEELAAYVRKFKAETREYPRNIDTIITELNDMFGGQPSIYKPPKSAVTKTFQPFQEEWTPTQTKHLVDPKSTTLDSFFQQLSDLVNRGPQNAKKLHHNEIIQNISKDMLAGVRVPAEADVANMTPREQELYGALRGFAEEHGLPAYQWPANWERSDQMRMLENPLSGSWVGGGTFEDPFRSTEAGRLQAKARPRPPTYDEAVKFWELITSKPLPVTPEQFALKPLAFENMFNVAKHWPSSTKGPQPKTLEDAIKLWEGLP